MNDLNDFQVEDSTNPPKPFSEFGFLFSQMTKDMKFVGMFTIIYGALNCLSIIGAIIGIPFIFIGLRIRDSADYFEAFRLTNDKRALTNAFEAQAKFFRISKIIIIVSVVLGILYLIGVIVFFSYIFNNLNHYSEFSNVMLR